MNRLTNRDPKDGLAYTVIPLNTSCVYDDINQQFHACYTGFVADRLAAYEDSGLQPEELQDALEELKNVENYASDAGMRLSEYRKLEEQGLLIKLPCKVGDTVYWISPFRSGINQGKIEFININKFGLDLAIMRQEGVLIRRGLETVFLTREEAEKALEA